MSSEQRDYNPILPFDITKGEHFLIYDNVTYYRDMDLLSNAEITVEAGNVIKYYRCGLNDTKKIGGDSVIDLKE